MAYVSPWWQALNLPDLWDVAGVIVPSLTVWHSLALSESGNAYALGRPASRDDAAGLLLICGMGMDDYRDLVFSTHRQERAARRMHRRLKRVPWDTLNAACRDYVQSSTRHMLRVSDDAGRPAVAPHEWHLVRTLCTVYRMTLAEAWATPYSLARCYYDANAEANGDKNIAPAAVQRDQELATGEAQP